MSSLGGEPDGYKAERAWSDAFAIWYWRDGGLGIVNFFILVAAVVLVFIFIAWLV